MIKKALSILGLIISLFIWFIGLILFIGGIAERIGSMCIVGLVFAIGGVAGAISCVKSISNKGNKNEKVIGLFDIFNFSKTKHENERLALELENTKKLLTPEMLEANKLEEYVAGLEQRKLKLENEITQCSLNLDVVQLDIEAKKKTLVDLDEELLYQDFALYKPKYDMMYSEEYKVRLNNVRSQQKELIKSDSAVTGDMNWTVNGSKSEGKKMVKDMQKLLLRAFNSECDEIINRVTYSNVEMSRKRIESSYEAVSKLGKIMKVSITGKYLKLKIEELLLAFEYKQKKQQEKEEQKELRAQQREEAKLVAEIEEARKKVQKEQKHYLNALETLNKQLLTASDAEKEQLEQKKSELLGQLDEIDKNLKDIDYREANAKAGYVYVISNIGAFGENVYKIGMTRRLDPQERIDELSDASVPFNFDVHAMIFSDNAPALEAALHKAFENKKVNMVNQRREFFSVSLDEIKDVVKKNFDKSVEFIDVPEAQQYRTSSKMRELANKQI